MGSLQHRELFRSELRDGQQTPSLRVHARDGDKPRVSDHEEDAVVTDRAAESE